MNRTHVFQVVLWIGFNSVFWGVIWSGFFLTLYLLWSNGDLDFPVFYGFILGSILGGFFLGILEAKNLNRCWRRLWVRSSIFWSGVWGVIFPLALGIYWWASSRDCNCDGNLMCLCPSGNLLISLAIWYLYSWVVVPGFFVMTLIGTLLWSWLFQLLTRRLF